jgi:hypothetical protein
MALYKLQFITETQHNKEIVNHEIHFRNKKDYNKLLKIIEKDCIPSNILP